MIIISLHISPFIMSSDSQTPTEEKSPEQRWWRKLPLAVTRPQSKGKDLLLNK
jgi:hypothetical protein